MLLDLRGFRGGVDQVDRVFSPDAFRLDHEEFRVVAPVEFKAQVTKDSQKVRLTGRVRTTLETNCGRCLEPFTVPVDAPFDLMFLPESDEPATREREVTADDVGVSFYKDDAIDLGDIMREQFFLAQPMKPLCQPDCQGLCPLCGVNRNRETCDCKTGWVDPRFAVLKKLLDT
jgi:uncharacterized protein